MTNLESTTGTFAEDAFRADMQAALHSVTGILKQVNEGDGYVGRLLRDPQEADRLSHLVGSLEQTSRELSATVRHANAVLGRVESGPGFAHEVIYGDGPTETLAQFGSAADEVALTLKGVREGNGPARSLLYGDDQSTAMMANLDAMSTDLRHIVADVRAGRGTLGALLVDPSVYEDLKLLLGNVERNRTLRALVRYSIERDEPMPGVQVTDPEVPPARPESGTGAAGAGKDAPR
jgi:phospholipid/cholesterol/gamma-HCH transport system substrate-binding protein